MHAQRSGSLHTVLLSRFSRRPSLDCWWHDRRKFSLSLESRKSGGLSSYLPRTTTLSAYVRELLFDVCILSCWPFYWLQKPKSQPELPQEPQPQPQPE